MKDYPIYFVCYLLYRIYQGGIARCSLLPYARISQNSNAKISITKSVLPHKSNWSLNEALKRQNCSHGVRGVDRHHG